MAELRLDSPLQYLKGVGPVRAEWFAELGLRCVGDLLGYFPFRYETELGRLEIADLTPGVIATACGAVRRVRGRWPTFSAEIADGTGSLWLRWFNRQPGGHGIYVGATVIATGKTQERQNRLEMAHPRVKVFEPDARLDDVEPRRTLVGVYRASERLKSPLIRRAVLSVFEQGAPAIDDVLPSALRIEHSFPTRGAAVRAMHLPEDEEQQAKARRRLAYGEFLLIELAMQMQRRRLRLLHRGQKLAVTPEINKRILARFPFPLTDAQRRVIREIVADMESGEPMTRLLQGDVGCGKTVVALYACLAAIANGRQAVVMAPTEVLAQQHYRNFETYLAGSRVRRLLLRGGMSKSERAEAVAAIGAGDVQLIVGTHALLQDDVSCASLGLVVVDEQHKFGVGQRAMVRTKGATPHYLVMTATPIPRTLAMTVFGDLDVSVIDGAPPGRGRVTTRVLRASDWPKLAGRLRPRLEAGEQAYLVCPSIGAEEPVEADPTTEDKAALASVREEYERLSGGAWRGLQLGLLHGGMPSDEKQAMIRAFSRGELHALIATTVIEVGVDVPNATLMIVQQADRFGLSQLHQLRGRIGRGRKDGECVLIAHSRGEGARERLRTMAETSDGFRIAEADLRLRGPGEMLGTRQHGLPELRVASFVDDFDLLEQARDDAAKIVNADPKLERPEHRRLLPALRRLYGGKLRFMDTA